MTRKQRPQRELISQDMISKFTKKLEHISASFANPQDKSLALWELKRPMLSPRRNQSSLTHVSSLSHNFKDANITQDPRKPQPHPTEHGIGCFCSSWAEIPGFDAMLIDAILLQQDLYLKNDGKPVPVNQLECSKQGNSWDTPRASRISVYHQVSVVSKKKTGDGTCADFMNVRINFLGSTHHLRTSFSPTCAQTSWVALGVNR